MINNAGGCTIESTNGSSWNQYGSDVTDVLGNNCYMSVMAGSTGVTIHGTGDSFGCQLDTTATFKGSNDGITAYGAAIGLLSGDQGINLNAASSQITSLTNTSIVDSNGSSSSFSGQRGDIMTLYGNNMSVFGNYMQINFIGNNDVCDGNWNTVNSDGTEGDNSGDYCYGYHDTEEGDTVGIYGPPPGSSKPTTRNLTQDRPKDDCRRTKGVRSPAIAAT